MIKLIDSQGNISTITENGEMQFDNNQVKDAYKQAEDNMNENKE